MLCAFGTTQQGSLGLINNIKSRVKGNFQAQLAPNDFGGSVRGLGELKIGVAKLHDVNRLEASVKVKKHEKTNLLTDNYTWTSLCL